VKSPVGQMFHQFFGENLLRADVCNAVEELGQLLDHTGPVAASERNAARIFHCDHLYFVTNGTSTSNKMVWHSTVAPNDIVVVDRNCHKSILHAIIMTGAIPVFLPPTRNHYGIIGPIPLEEFEPASIQAKIDAHPFIDQANSRTPRILTITQSTYDGIAYNVETIKQKLDGYIDTLHFDEAWLPHAAFHDFYGDYHAIGEDRPRCEHSLIFSTQSTHKLLAGLSQASQILVQESRTRKLDRDVFNESYLMHSSTSPQYAIIASCDIAAAMMEPPGGTALVEESLMEAAEFRRAMRDVEAELGDWWFKVWGPDYLAEEGVGQREDWLLRPNDRWHGFGAVAEGFNILDPIKATIITPGLDVEGEFDEWGHSGRRGDALPCRARHRGRENGPLFFFHHVYHRHHQGPLEYHGHRAAAVQGRLRRQPQAVAGDARIRRQTPAVRGLGAARPVPAHPRLLQGARRG